ncbi:hypothetical protein DIPPA_24855 [Diplonema papillatum]|nr:hypothetical protein DIPPA_24855 [Diplonema papillatum]
MATADHEQTADTSTTLHCRECGRKEDKGIEDPDVRVVTSRQTLCSRTVVTGFCPSCKRITSWYSRK